jgi:hypothetical protein
MCRTGVCIHDSFLVASGNFFVYMFCGNGFSGVESVSFIQENGGHLGVVNDGVCLPGDGVCIASNCGFILFQ